MIDNDALVIVLVSVACGVFATWNARAFARRRGIVNDPNPIIPQHTRPVAYLGGVGILVGAALAGFVLQGLGRTTPADTGFAAHALAFLALGTADDLFTFKPPLKFGLQVLLSLSAVTTGAVYPLTGNVVSDAAITAFIILVFVNAFNLTDVCDGLLGGLAVMTLAFTTLLEPQTANFALLFAGATVGFLVFNLPPASIYLGDGGSHLLGYICAALLIAGGSGRAGWPYTAQAALVAAVPLFELVFLVIVRARKGIPWWRGSPDHYSLRLQEAGWSKRTTDVASWTAAVAAGVVAVNLGKLAAGGQIVAVAVVIVAFAAIGTVLTRWEVTPK